MTDENRFYITVADGGSRRFRNKKSFQTPYYVTNGFISNGKPSFSTNPGKEPVDSYLAPQMQQMPQMPQIQGDQLIGARQWIKPNTMTNGSFPPKRSNTFI